MSAGGIIWYPGTVNARTADLLAHLSNGTTTRLVPAVVGGRKYFVLGAGEGVKLTRLTLYDARRHVLADVTAFPPQQVTPTAYAGALLAGLRYMRLA